MILICGLDALWLAARKELTTPEVVKKEKRDPQTKRDGAP